MTDEKQSHAEPDVEQDNATENAADSIPENDSTDEFFDGEDFMDRVKQAAAEAAIQFARFMDSIARLSYETKRKMPNASTVAEKIKTAVKNPATNHFRTATLEILRGTQVVFNSALERIEKINKSCTSDTSDNDAPDTDNTTE